MTTKEVANKLVEYCKAGKNLDAINELYAENIVSLEPEGSNHNQRTEGKEAVINKTQEWFKNVKEMHSSEISQPIVSGNHFSVTMDMDLTMEGVGRTQMNEVCVYQVQNGKISKEQFFHEV